MRRYGYRPELQLDREIQVACKAGDFPYADVRCPDCGSDKWFLHGEMLLDGGVQQWFDCPACCLHVKARTVGWVP